jgi:hypothetical protein
MNIVSLFPNQTDTSTLEQPSELLYELFNFKSYDKIVVIGIKDINGSWTTEFHKAGATNAEANLAVDLIKDHILKGLLA